MQAKVVLPIYTILMTISKWSLSECRKQDFLKSFEIDENLLQKRCELICYRKSPDKVKQCSMKNCLEDISKLSKAGTCPKAPARFLDITCFDDCQSYDYECPGIKKCCRQDCGWSCQDPDGLDKDSNLPPIPFNITIAERRKSGRMCEISWQTKFSHSQKLPIYFVVEVRSHIGNVFVSHKLGNWQWYNFHKIAETTIHEAGIKSTVANIKLRNGRWYQFRVAAINEYGFRGYSNISRGFRLSDPPKPPKPPKNFSVASLVRLPNGTLYAKASWSLPKSDLPVEKYKISWALYLKAENDSLLLNDAYVKEPIRHYDFWNLSPNSVYYLQVQAISINGKRRLKSLQESLLLNTTNPVTVTFGDGRNTFNLINSTEYGITSGTRLRIGSKSKHSEFDVKFIANRKQGMLVRVLWDNDLFKGSILELCTGTADCETKEYGAARPKKDHIDFGKLKFNTQYTVRLIDPNQIDKDLVIKAKTFTTPICENWIQKFPYLSINCS